MPGILKKLKALEIKESPFVKNTKGAIIHYVKPSWLQISSSLHGPVQGV